MRIAREKGMRQGILAAAGLLAALAAFGICPGMALADDGAADGDGAAKQAVVDDAEGPVERAAADPVEGSDGAVIGDYAVAEGTDDGATDGASDNGEASEGDSADDPDAEDGMEVDGGTDADADVPAGDVADGDADSAADDAEADAEADEKDDSELDKDSDSSDDVALAPAADTKGTWVSTSKGYRYRLADGSWPSSNG